MATKSMGRENFRSVGYLFILKQSRHYASAMHALAANGLRPLTYQEALSHSSELMREIRGKNFHLAGRGIKEDGVFAFDENGELVKPTGNETYDRKVRVYPGDRPLYFYVDSFAYAHERFVIFGFGLDALAPAVVGIRDEMAILAQGRVALERLKRDSPGLGAVLNE